MIIKLIKSEQDFIHQKIVQYKAIDFIFLTCLYFSVYCYQEGATVSDHVAKSFRKSNRFFLAFTTFLLFFRHQTTVLETFEILKLLAAWYGNFALPLLIDFLWFFQFCHKKKTHKLGCKFKEFPKLMADVIENLENSKDSFVHLHITESTCL